MPLTEHDANAYGWAAIGLLAQKAIMKFGTARVLSGREVVIAVDGDGRARVVEDVRDMLDLIDRWDELKANLRLGKEPISIEEVDILAPIPRPPRSLFCVGKNYREHAVEFTKSGFDSSASSQTEAIPEHPIIFSKVQDCVIAHGQAVQYPEGVSDGLDYEAELAVIIGRGGRAIPRSRALEHVFGYAIFNDVTARDLQARHKQWLIGKSLDTFGPFGPWIVTADEIDPADLDIRCWVNGELRQSSNTRHLIFDVQTLIETISAGLTLHTGDIIATGTPAGVGIGFTPPRYLARGDKMTVEISKLGRLENTVA
jgi:2-keto-4-pentenoate hydratase/2-oxohepta-3-ene-1,7-dioic acid hydratase in catechol pathway